LPTIIGVIVALGVLITVHEFGHFLVARWSGVHVEKFSLGFGPRIVGWQRGDTEYRIAAIPLGGYVKMRGENPGEASEPEGSFTARPWWSRSLIGLAGPAANVLFAVLVFIVSFWMGKTYDDQPPVVGTVDSVYSAQLMPGDVIERLNGQPIDAWSRLVRYTHADAPDTLALRRGGLGMTVVLDSLSGIDWYTRMSAHADPVIGDVMPGLPAFQAGLKAGDVIEAVNGAPVAAWNEMRSLVTGSSSGTVQLTVRRGDNVFSPVIALDSTLAGTDGKLIGITQSMPVRLHERFSLGESIVNGGLSTALIVAQTYSGLYQLIKAPSSLRSNIGSPVMMVPMGQQVARRGLSDVLFLLGTISVLLAIMNLLPIPVLDGGLILFCLYEGLFRKPLSVRTQQVLQQIGAALLLFLMIFAIYNDAAKLVTRGVSLREQTQVIRQ